MAGRVRRRLSHGTCRTRAVRPRLEGLEDRFLLYATTGTQWAKPKLITYSFVPDGTSIGGVPSNLQQTLNAQLRHRRLEGAVRQGGDGLAEGGQRQLHAGLRQRLRPGRLREPAERLPVRRHPDRRLRHVGQHPGVRLPRAAGQRRDQRRRHVLQHHPVVADQRDDLRPDDGGRPRVRPRDRHGPQHATARRPCTRPTPPPSKR